MNSPQMLDGLINFIKEHKELFLKAGILSIAGLISLITANPAAFSGALSLFAAPSTAGAGYKFGTKVVEAVMEGIATLTGEKTEHVLAPVQKDMIPKNDQSALHELKAAFNKTPNKSLNTSTAHRRHNG